MDELILALQLMQSKMTSTVTCPTHCEHDELHVYPGVPKSAFTDAELEQLDGWGFAWNDEWLDDEDAGFVSGRFGSC
jgi:hypothetical protein